MCYERAEVYPVCHDFMNKKKKSTGFFIHTLPPYDVLHVFLIVFTGRDQRLRRVCLNSRF